MVNSFRPNKDLKIKQAVQELKVGEALVSLLDEEGTPTETKRILIRPPASKVGSADPEIVRTFIVKASN